MGPPGGVALPGWNACTGRMLQDSGAPNLAGLVVEPQCESSSGAPPRLYVHNPYGSSSSSSAACSDLENDMLFGGEAAVPPADLRPSEAFRQQNERWGLRTPDRFATVDEHDDRQVASPPSGSGLQVVPQQQEQCRVAGAAGLRHMCPVQGCKASYASSQPLLNHIESAHLTRSDGGVVISDSFLSAYSRWLCCGLFMPLNKACRECQHRGPREHCRRPQAGVLHSSVAVGPEGPAYSELALVPPDVMAQTDELLSLSGGTLHHLPPACRKPLADALAEALRRLHEKHDAQSAWLVALLPRLVLFPLSRGGRKHNRHAVGVILDRLQRWSVGAYRELVAQAIQSSGGGSKRKSKTKSSSDSTGDALDASVARGVINAVSEGSLSKAAKLLKSRAVPSENVDELRKLHPPRMAPVTPVAPESEAFLEFEVSEVRRACRSFPPGSTGGPSGLRPCHLVEMLKADEDDTLAQALADFVSDFNAGKIPEEARPWLCGARLIGLEKEPSGVRPIAIGEVLRHLAGKCLIARCQDDVVSRLLPQQMGVGVANAPEIISHAVQAWAESARSDESLILVDFSNAYNSLDRQKMLEAIAAEAPAFLPYANFCYGVPTPLRGRSFQLWSEEGTQQGDCCGPIFFSVALQKLVRECCPHSVEAWNRWYLDDGTLCGQTTAVEGMFASLVQKSPEFGLKVNLEKCKQWGPTPSQTALAPCVPWESGIKVLGVPIGPASFVREFSRKVLAKLQSCLERLRLLGCAFSALHILRSCLSVCKVVFLLRTLPFDLALELAAETQVKIRSTLCDILDTPLDDTQWSLARLPVRRGGLGFLDPVIAAAPAHVAAFLSSSAAAALNGLPACKVRQAFFNALTALAQSSPAHVSAIRTLVRVGLPVPGHMAQRELFEMWCDQHQWSDALHEGLSTLLETSLPIRMRRMRELASGAHAGSWLLSPSPQHHTPKWASSEWRLLLLWRLGIPLGLPIACVACGACQDAYGDHALSCAAMGTYRRHNTVRDAFVDLAVGAGLQCRTSVGLPGTNLVPGDLFLPAFSDVPSAVDVSVVHPLHPSRMSQAAVTTGAAAEARAVEKVALYGDQCKERSWDLWAVVAETTGAWCGSAQRFVRQLARKRALRTGEVYREVVADSWTAVAHALARAVARQLVRARQVP